jgi:hypothetical protein
MVLKLTTIRIDGDCDDSSVSSTFTVDRENKCLHCSEVDGSPCVANPNTKTKQVRFDLSNNDERLVEKLNIEDCQARWYSPKNYRDFKTLAYDAATQIVNIEARNRAPYSYQRVLEKTFEACLKANTDVEEVLPASELIHLQRWLEVASSRCGLEKWAIRKISRDKSCRRKELGSAVLSIQANMKTTKCTVLSDVDEFICVTSENISRPSRLYARTVAQALAAAIEADAVATQ